MAFDDSLGRHQICSIFSAARQVRICPVRCTQSLVRALSRNVDSMVRVMATA